MASLRMIALTGHVGVKRGRAELFISEVGTTDSAPQKSPLQTF